MHPQPDSPLLAALVRTMQHLAAPTVRAQRRAEVAARIAQVRRRGGCRWCSTRSDVDVPWRRSMAIHRLAKTHNMNQKQHFDPISLFKTYF
jgi:hypothetical protein